MGVRDHRRCEAAVRRSRVGQDSLDPAASPLSRRKGKDEEGSCPLDGTGPRGWPSDLGEQPWLTRRNIADRRLGTDDDRPEGDLKSTRLNSRHYCAPRRTSSAGKTTHNKLI